MYNSIHAILLFICFFVKVTYISSFFSFSFSSIFLSGETKTKTNMSRVNITMFFLLLSSLYALFFPLRVLHSFFFLSFASSSVCRITCTSLYYVYFSQLNNRMTMLVCVACMCICCVNVTKWVTI